MSRSIARFLLTLAFGVCAGTLRAEAISTKCSEREVVLDAMHTSARLERCGDDTPSQLLWHLDRIDQSVSRLDNRYDSMNGGAGLVTMDAPKSNLTIESAH